MSESRGAADLDGDRGAGRLRSGHARALAEPRRAPRRRGVDGRHRRHPSANVDAGDLVVRPLPLWPAILSIEALVVVVEAALIAWMARLTPARAGAVSLAANAASFLFGLWLTA